MVGEWLRAECCGLRVTGNVLANGPQVKKDHGTDAAAGQGGILSRFTAWVGHGNVAADVPHAQTAGNGAVHEQSAAAEVVDEIEEPDEGDDGLDDAEDAGGQEGGVGAGDADGAEDGWGIVVDGVDTLSDSE